MRRSRMLALTGTAALVAAIAGSATATAVPSAPTAAATGNGSYVVLADTGADASAIQQLYKHGRSSAVVFSSASNTKNG